MKKSVVFILENGITEKALTSFEPFLFEDKELVTWPNKQKAYIYKKDKNIKWQYCGSE